MKTIFVCHCLLVMFEIEFSQDGDFTQNSILEQYVVTGVFKRIKQIKWQTFNLCFFVKSICNWYT